MFERQKTGSVVCPSCGKLVGVQEKECPFCGRVRPGMFGLTKSFRDLGFDLNFSNMILWACGLVYLLSLMRDTSALFEGGLLRMLSPTNESADLFGMTGVSQVLEQGRWWTLLSAGWLHGGLIHIGFNLYALRFLGPITAKLFGQGRFLIIYTVASAAGFALSVAVGWVFLSMIQGGSCLVAILARIVGPGAIFGSLGASAGLTGLVGALLYYGRRGGNRALGQQAKTWIISILVFGIVFSGIDNWAHLGGILGGYLMARILDPLKPERTDHVLIGLLCFVLSLGAVAFSVIRGLTLAP